MFGGFREKTHFEVYCKKLDSNPTVKKRKHHKAFTAAYLIILSDLVLGINKDSDEREATIEQAFAFVRKYLPRKELRAFDDSLALFARIWNGEVMPRGDWCFYNREDENPFHKLYLCYGDLLWDPNCLNDYENARTMLKGIFETTDFFKDIWEVQFCIAEYIQLFVKS